MSHLSMVHALSFAQPCFLDQSSEMKAFEFNQTVLLSKLKLLHADMMRIELFKWVLSSVIEPDAESYYKDTEIAVLSLERTAHYIAKWTRNVQNISWPENGIEFAKRAIGFAPIPTGDENAYNEIAQKVQKAFEEHVSKSYTFQVLVVPSSDTGISWSVATEGTGIYTNITDFNGIDIHIFRFDKSEIKERIRNASKWMQEKRLAMQKRIKLDALMDAKT
ncbi:hypothetical protein PENTCL1PPCAC_12278, partial [Pristionchus entomophagus]